MRIAVDVMGGDHGCGVIVAGVKLALEANERISELHLVGDEAEIRNAIQNCECQDPRLKIQRSHQA